MNPFASSLNPGAEYVDADSRIRLVKLFTEEECFAALRRRDLQKTVLAAIERRIQRLAKERP